MALACLVAHIRGGRRSSVTRVCNPVPILGNPVQQPIVEAPVVRHPLVPV